MTSPSFSVPRSGRAPTPAVLAENYFVLFCMALSELPQDAAARLALDRAAVLLELTLEEQNKPLPIKLRTALQGLRDQLGISETDEHGVGSFRPHVQPCTKSA